MFGFPRNFTQPGFNVRNPDSDGGDDVPGFAVPNGGCEPSGPERQRVILNDATWREYFNQIARRAR